MIKRLLLLLLIGGGAIGAAANDYTDIFSSTFSAEEAMAIEPTLTLKGNTAHVQHAQGEVLEIFSLTGTKVTSIKIESNDVYLTLDLSRGIYLFKVGKMVRKVAIS